MRPRIQRSLSVDVSTQAQRIIKALSDLYGVNYYDVRKAYYRYKEDISVVKYHLKVEIELQTINNI